jgi:hypothetical protein
MFGDPKLNRWEKQFIDSVARWGWHSDYTQKQKKVLDRLFLKMKQKNT